MAVPSDAEYQAAITAHDRTPIWQVRADWDRDGYQNPQADLSEVCDEIQVNRQLTGDLPPEVGLVEGYAAAELTLTVAGVWPGTAQSALRLFSPLSADSPLYGKRTMKAPVTVETGFLCNSGRRTTPQFTGNVRTISPDSSTGDVKIAGLDPANLLRQPITLGAVGLDSILLAQHGPAQYSTRWNSQWIIDFILRRNGIYASPPPRRNAILFATGHGSTVPEIGFGGTENNHYPTYRGPHWFPGPFGMLAHFNDGPQCFWFLDQPLTSATGTGFGFSTWTNMRPPESQFRDLLRLDLAADNSTYLHIGTNQQGQPVFSMENGYTGEFFTAAMTDYQPLSTNTWLFLGMHVTFYDTTMTVTFRCNGQEQSVSRSIPRRDNDWRPTPTISVVEFQSMVSTQLWPSFTPPDSGTWWGEEWTPQADLDPGANNLTGFPQLNDEDSWGLLKEIVAAELGSCGFSETGRFWFRSRVGNLARTAVAETISADRNLESLVSTTDEASIRNIVSMTYTPILVDDWGRVFAADNIEQFVVPAYTTGYFQIPMPDGVYDYPRSEAVYFPTEQQWNDSENDATYKYQITAMVVQQALTTLIVTSNVAMRLVRSGRTTWVLVISNNNNFGIKFCTPYHQQTDGSLTPGNPALRIPARVVAAQQQQSASYVAQGSIDTYGPSSYDLSGGSSDRWRQEGGSMEVIANSILATTSYPVPVLNSFDSAHDPRRTLGQRIRIADPDGQGVVDAHIIGIDSTISASGGATDTITARLLGAPGVGLFDDPELGLLDSTMILAP